MLSLFQGAKTCRAVQKHTQLNDRTVRKRLGLLWRNGFVTQKKTRGKRGQPIFNSLTLKGEKRCMDEAVADVKAAFRVIMELTSSLSHDSEKISELRGSLNQPLISQSDIQNLPLEETLTLFSQRERQTHGLLQESLKNIFDLFLELELPWPVRQRSGKDFVIGIRKDGCTYLIPVALLKAHGLGVGL